MKEVQRVSFCEAMVSGVWGGRRAGDQESNRESPMYCRYLRKPGSFFLFHKKLSTRDDFLYYRTAKTGELCNNGSICKELYFLL